MVQSRIAASRTAGVPSLLSSAHMLYVFYFLVLEQILQGAYSLYEGLQWLRMSRLRFGLPSGFYLPRVALFCPVKGLEPGLEQNLIAHTQFDYRQDEIFFAVATAEDPAYSIIERVAANSKRKVHIITAGRARDCGKRK